MLLRVLVWLTGFGLDDQKWHTVRVTRHARLVLIALDGKSVRSETLMSSTSVLKRSRYTLAAGTFLLGWSDLALCCTLLTIRHIFTISHPKNHQVFIFKKFTETLKSTSNICSKICKYLFSTSKNYHQKKNSKLNA